MTNENIEKEKKKLPEPEEIIEDLYDKCTCDIYEWSSQSCPFAEEIGENHDQEYCCCCPYCTCQCAWDI